MAALIALGRQVVARLAPGLIAGLGGGVAAEALTGSAIDIPFFGPGTFGGNGRRRRRRRKALTGEDMRTALTIASAISKKAAENFILSRTRAS